MQVAEQKPTHSYSHGLSPLLLCVCEPFTCKQANYVCVSAYDKCGCMFVFFPRQAKDGANNGKVGAEERVRPV